MKIFGVGLSKTGTTSLHHALRILGLKSIHFAPERLNDILDGSNVNPDFRRYDDVDAITDEPAAYFYEELFAAYPESKFILTVRNEDAWWRSISSHFNKESNWEINKFGKQYIYGSARASEFLFRKKYRQHNADVIARIPGDRLLMMDITAGDGWEKLCPFLNIKIPEVSFPYVNKRILNEQFISSGSLIVSELEKLVSPGGVLILVDDLCLGLGKKPIPDRRVIPFLERDGQYWGPPKDDETAISELERLSRAGATHIVFTLPAFWWLEHYAGFHGYLRSRFPCVLESRYLVAFQLRNAPAHGKGI
jgi:Sulfotransferase domain